LRSTEFEIKNKISNRLSFSSGDNEDSKRSSSLDVLMAQQMQNQEIQNQLKELQAVQAEVVKALANVATQNGSFGSSSLTGMGISGRNENDQDFNKSSR